MPDALVSGTAVGCPYPDCEKRNLHGTGRCPQCERRIKPCGVCGAPNRMLAVYCRMCGSRLPDRSAQWTGLQGGADRRGLNPRSLPRPLGELAIEQIAQLDLEGPCHDLLLYDGFLIALSSRGTIVATAVEPHGGSLIHWSAGGELTAHSCVAQGALYVAVEGQIRAFDLAGLEEKPAQVHGAWAAPIEGTAVHGLLDVRGRLFLDVIDAGGGHRVVSIERSAEPARWRGGAPPQETHYEGRFVSPLVASASAAGEQVSFFAQDEGALSLHQLSWDSGSRRPKLQQRKIKAPGRLQEHRVVAAIGTKLYGVFGDDDLLCRFDAEHALFEERLASDTRAFAMSGIGAGVAIQSQGLFLLPQALLEPTDDPLRGHPVILRDSAVAVGLADGRLRLHDLKNPSAVLQLRVSKRGVTMVVSAGSYVAAGAEDGVVRLWKLRERGDG